MGYRPANATPECGQLVSRRELLGAIGGLASVGVAGCIGNGDEGDEDDDIDPTDQPGHAANDADIGADADADVNSGGGIVYDDFTPVDSLTDEYAANHLHGVGFDHERELLYLASHFGLYVLDETGDLFIVGDSRDDHMGFTMHPDDPKTLYRSGHPYGEPGNLGVERSTDGGRTWDQIFTGVEDETVDFHSMAISPADPDVLVGSYRGAIYVTEDGGENWTIADGAGLPAVGTCWGAQCLATDTADRETIYGGTAEGLFRSDDLGDSWELVTDMLTIGILVHPESPEQLWGFVPEGIVTTTDGGDSWELFLDHTAFREEEMVFGFAVDYSDPASLFAGTSADRVFRSDDGGEIWSVVLG